VVAVPVRAFRELVEVVFVLALVVEKPGRHLPHGGRVGVSIATDGSVELPQDARDVVARAGHENGPFQPRKRRVDEALGTRLEQGRLEVAVRPCAHQESVQRS